jgi:hypothetical protein
MAYTLIFCSCSTIQTGIYLVSIDQKNGDRILQNEINVRMFLKNILKTPEEYIIQGFERTGLSSRLKRSALIVHSFYLITDKTGSYHTLSFYGTKIAFYSEGAWALDADSDVGSYELYLDGPNPWSVKEIKTENRINVQETVKNILKKMDSDITFYYKDHVNNKPNMDNCNTALRETLVENYCYGNTALSEQPP